MLTAALQGGGAGKLGSKRRGTWICRRSPVVRGNEPRGGAVDGLCSCEGACPFNRCRQVRDRLQDTAAGEHAAVGRSTAIVATAGGHFYAAALGADNVAEYIALDGRRCDGKGGLQDEHKRRQKRDADPSYPLLHVLSQLDRRYGTTPAHWRKPPANLCGKMPSLESRYRDDVDRLFTFLAARRL